MAVDQFISTALGGHPDDTVSQRLGRAQLSGGGRVIRASVWIVDSIALAIAGERDHCLNSLRGKTMASELWNWGGSHDQIMVEEFNQ